MRTAFFLLLSGCSSAPTVENVVDASANDGCSDCAPRDASADAASADVAQVDGGDGAPASGFALDPGGPPFVLHGEKDWGQGQVTKANVLDAQGWQFFAGYGNLNRGPWTNFVVNRNQLTAPSTSPQDIVEARWPTTLAGGTGPFTYTHFFPALASRLWIAMTFWFDPLWSNGANSGTKWAFLPMANKVGDVSTSSTNHFINLVLGSGTSLTELFGFSTQFNGGTGTNKNYPGVSPSLFLDGQWHIVEIYLELNSAPGLADGIYMVAVDGVVRRTVSNVVYVGPGTPSDSRFNAFKWNPTFGYGTNSPPQDLFCYMDHIRFKSR
jgi:hypothetical protein